LSRSLFALDQNSTIIDVVELSHSSWLLGGVVPGIERQLRKVTALPQFRDAQLLHAEPGFEGAVAVAVAPGGAVAAGLFAPGANQPFDMPP
jgi:transposase